MARKQGAKGRALITGASAGIGLELARVFARNGHDLVLAARSEEKLTQIAGELNKVHGVDAVAIRADLNEPNAPFTLHNAVKERGLEVDILVNNAGVLEAGAFQDMDTNRLLQLTQINVSALTALTSLFIKDMAERGRGRILNVASLAAFQPLPSLAAYAASKAYVLSLTEALAEEMRRKGVTLTALCPGFTETGMVENAQKQNPALKAIPSTFIADAKSVAEEGYRACMNGDVIRVPGMALQIATGLIQAQRSIARTFAGMLGRQVM